MLSGTLGLSDNQRLSFRMGWPLLRRLGLLVGQDPHRALKCLL